MSITALNAFQRDKRKPALEKTLINGTDPVPVFFSGERFLQVKRDPNKKIKIDPRFFRNGF